MRKASKKSTARIFSDTDNATFLLEFVDGPSRSSSPDGPPIEKSGPGAAHVSLSRSLPQIGKEWRTRDTFGPSFGDSSPGDSLQRSLENRLRARLDGIGSLEYKLTWKHWDIGSGRLICALRASTPRTSGRGCIGWPTATVRDQKGHGLLESARVRQSKGKAQPLNEVAALTGYGTPRATDGTHGGPNQDDQSALPRQAGLITRMSGYATPVSSDHLANASETIESWRSRAMEKKTEGINLHKPLRIQAQEITGYATPNSADSQGSHGVGQGASLRTDSQRITHGGKRRSDDGQTGPRGALNPALARWLSGYPVEWDECAIRAHRLMPITRRKRG